MLLLHYAWQPFHPPILSYLPPAFLSRSSPPPSSSWSLLWLPIIHPIPCTLQIDYSLQVYAHDWWFDQLSRGDTPAQSLKCLYLGWTLDENSDPNVYSRKHFNDWGKKSWSKELFWKISWGFYEGKHRVTVNFPQRVGTKRPGRKLEHISNMMINTDSHPFPAGLDRNSKCAAVCVWEFLFGPHQLRLASAELWRAMLGI